MEGIGAFLLDAPSYQQADIKKFSKLKDQKIDALVQQLEAISNDQWTGDEIDRAIKSFAERNNSWSKDHQLYIRWLLTGVETGLPIHRTLQVLGKTESLDRLQNQPTSKETKPNTKILQMARPGGFLHQLLAQRYGDDTILGLLSPAASDEALNAIEPFGVGNKVARLHGELLANELPALKALQSRGDSLEGQKTKLFGRALGQIYHQIGRQLSALPNVDRSGFLRDVLKHLDELAEVVGSNDLLVPTWMAFVDLIGQQTVTPGQAREHVETLLQMSSERGGAGALLNTYPNIVAQLGSKSGAFDPEVLQKARDALLAGTPQGQVEQIHVSRFARTLHSHLKEESPGRALDATVSSLRKSAMRETKADREELAGVPGDPSKTASALLNQMPLADVALVQSLQTVTTNPAAASVVETVLQQAIAAPEAAENLVGFLEDNLRQLNGDAALFSQAANAENVPGFVQTLLAERAKKTNGAGQLLEPVIQDISTLSPAEAARVLRVFWNRLTQAKAADLAKGLVVAARKPEFRSYPALANFAERYLKLVTRFPAESPWPLPVALRTNGVLKPNDTKILAAAVEAVLLFKDAPVEALLFSDANGKPGLTDLCQTDQYMQDPLPQFRQLVRAIPFNKVKAEDRLPVLRHVIAMAHELGAIDPARAPLLPRVQTDLQQALENPEKLKLPYLQHSEALPPTLAFTAGLHLSKGEMTWLTQTLEGCRNRQQVRDLRDVVFAAVEFDRLDLIHAMAEASRADALAAAEDVSVLYRQGRLSTRAFDVPLARLRGEEPPALANGREKKDAAAPLGMAELSGTPIHPDGKKLLDQHKDKLTAIVQYLGPRLCGF